MANNRATYKESCGFRNRFCYQVCLLSHGMGRFQRFWHVFNGTAKQVLNKSLEKQNRTKFLDVVCGPQLLPKLAPKSDMSLTFWVIAFSVKIYSCSISSSIHYHHCTNKIFVCVVYTRNRNERDGGGNGRHCDDNSANGRQDCEFFNGDLRLLTSRSGRGNC